MTAWPSPGAHVDPHDIVGYLENTLGAADRARVETHLSACEECTAELVAVRRLHHQTSRQRHWIGIAAAAAGIAAILLLRPGIGREPESPPPVRGGADSGIAIVAPAEGASVTESPLFTWRAVPGAAAYRISVSRADGDSVWSATLPDTSVRAPAGALVGGTALYYWYVDALLADGRSVPGTAHEFRLRP